MGEIFSQADAVIVWLGEDTTDLNNFLWMHWNFLSALCSYGEEHGIETMRRQHPYDPNFLMKLRLVPPCGSWSEAWGNFFEFFRKRSWFSRAWCVQEVVLAKSVYVECGRSCIPWERIDVLTTLIEKCGWHHSAKTIAQKTHSIPTGQETIRICRINHDLRDYLKKPVNVDESQRTNNELPMSSGGAPKKFRQPLLAYLLAFLTEVRSSPQGYAVITTNCNILKDNEPDLHWFEYLQRLLYLTRPHLSSDPRDKIYAYLGIAQKALLPGKTMPIVPNYSSLSTPETLYRFVATILLTRHPRLSNLSYVEDKRSRRLHNLPSWVPDYSCPDVPQPLIILRGPTFMYECCPQRYGPTWVTVNPEGSLKTRGARFDRIVAISDPLSATLDAFDISTWFGICAGLEAPYMPTQEDLSEAFWRTLIADTFDKSPAPDSMRKAFKSWICAHLAMTAAQKRNLGFTEEQSWSHISALLRPFEDGKARIGSQAMPEVVTYDRRVAALLPAFKESYGKADLEAERACELATHLYVLPTLLEVKRKHYETFHSSRARRYANEGEARILFDREQIQEFLKSGMTTGGLFVMANAEGMVASDEKVSQPFEDALQDVMKFRALYRTEGGYLGLGPRSVEYGDEVWLLQGAGVPFILRKDGEQSELIGETYLHGFMDGKMAQKVIGRIGVVTIA